MGDKIDTKITQQNYGRVRRKKLRKERKKKLEKEKPEKEKRRREQEKFEKGGEKEREKNQFLIFFIQSSLSPLEYKRHLNRLMTKPSGNKHLLTNLT
jgi:DNA-directed RNA polymerase